jgi:hypothetical protein
VATTGLFIHDVRRGNSREAAASAQCGLSTALFPLSNRIGQVGLARRDGYRRQFRQIDRLLFVFPGYVAAAGTAEIELHHAINTGIPLQTCCFGSQFGRYESTKDCALPSGVGSRIKSGPGEAAPDR